MPAAFSVTMLFPYLPVISSPASVEVRAFAVLLASFPITVVPNEMDAKEALTNKHNIFKMSHEQRKSINKCDIDQRGARNG